MTKRFLLFALASLAISCGSATSNSSTPNRSNTTVAKTNVNAVNSVPYSQTENAYSFAQNSELGTLAPSGKNAKELIGKTMTEAKLFENKKVYSRLRDLMGADYLTMRKSWNVETPIKKFGDFLMMTGCERHNCGENRYAIVMDMGTSDINVFHFEMGKSKVWNNGYEIKLPPTFEEELAAMKSNKQ